MKNELDMRTSLDQVTKWLPSTTYREKSLALQAKQNPSETFVVECGHTPSKTLQHAVDHIRRIHMNTRSWSLPLADEQAIEILENLVRVEPRQVTEAEADYEDGYDDVQSLA